MSLFKPKQWCLNLEKKGGGLGGLYTPKVGSGSPARGGVRATHRGSKADHMSGAGSCWEPEKIRWMIKSGTWRRWGSRWRWVPISLWPLPKNQRQSTVHQVPHPPRSSARTTPPTPLKNLPVITNHCDWMWRSQ